MFYEVEVPCRPGAKDHVAALVVLNPSESRRLLAKATVALPEVQHALAHGTIIIGRGVTNAYVTEELLGIRIEPKAGLTFSAASVRRMALAIWAAVWLRAPAQVIPSAG